MHSMPELQRHWYVVARSSELRNSPRAVLLLGRRLVLFRDANGVAHGLEDRCPHRNAPLSAGCVVKGTLQCPYHGWRFDGDGECTAVPGLQGEARHRSRKVTPRATMERDGFVWMAASPEAAKEREPASCELVGQPGFHRFYGEGLVNASFTDGLENFLDGTHTHFVHAGLIRTEGRRKPVRAQVVRGRDNVEIAYRDEGVQSGLIWRLFGGGIDLTVARFRLPTIAELEYSSAGSVRMRITLHFTPHDEKRTTIFALVAYRAPSVLALLGEPIMKALFRKALKQDTTILEMQSENLRAFDEQRFVFTELDVMAPHMLRLLKHGPGSEGEAPVERLVTMNL